MNNQKNIDQRSDFKLLRMILIDSYSQGHAVEIKIDGHTTINGRNAAGKTTLLRLLPIFLGESPSKIIRSSAGTENFSKHYFPTMASYVIYEYQRKDQKALAVIHGDGQRDTVSYRFIGSGYEDRLFYENGTVIQSNDLYRHLNKIGVGCTKELSLSTYRQILQNNASREYRALATQYSFCGSGGRINHLERVISGILQRVATFDDLRRMVISSVQEEDKQFALSTGRAELRKWIEEFQSHQELMEKTAVMESLDQADARRINIVGQLSDLHGKFKTLLTYQEQQKHEAETSLENARLQKRKAESEYSEKLQLLNDDKSGYDSKVKISKQTLENIEQRYIVYQQDKIDDKCTRVDAIPELDAKLTLLKDQHERLLGTFTDIDAEFQKLKADSERVAQLESSSLEQSKSAIWEQFQSGQEELQVAHKFTLSSMQEAQLLEITALKTKQSDLETQIAVHKERIENVVGDLGLQSELELARLDLTDKSKSHSLANEAARMAERELTKARQNFEVGESQLNEASFSLEDAERKLDQLKALQSADDETLLGFMRNHKPEWVANIGRIINEDLLLRKDLVPDVADGESLYGISIDLEKIDAGRMADEEVFKRELIRTEDKVKHAQKAVDDDEAAYHQLSEKRNQAQEAYKIQEASAALAQSAKSVAESRVSSLLIQYEMSRKLSLDAAKSALEQYETEYKKVNGDIGKLQHEHKKQLQKLQSDLDEKLKNEKTNHNLKLENIKQQQHAIMQKLAVNKEILDEECSSSLAKQGIDPKVLGRLSVDISSVEVQIESAKREVTAVAQYRSWLESIWPTRRALESEITEYLAKLQASQLEISALLLERKKIYDRLDETIRSKEQESIKISSWIGYIKKHIDELSQYEPVENSAQLPYDRANTLHSLSDQKAQAVDSLRKEITAIAVGIEDVRRAMINRPNTRPEQYHSTAFKERGSLIPGREYESLDIIRGWFVSEHLVHRTSLLQLAKTMAMNISAFWTSLNDFKKKVASFERELRGSLDQGALFDRIAEVDVQISTDLDKQDYWDAIERLHSEYETWHAQGESTLPPVSFVNAAVEVSSKLTEDKGLVANPIDLLRIKVAASVNGRHVIASNEKELETMSSTGLSYIVLCVVLVGFVNRIRGNQQVTVPWPVDELRDLDFDNARTLIELLSRNNISLVAAFPDVDTDLAPLFDRNYKILEGRKVGIVKLDESVEDLASLEVANV
ncbi:MAG: ATP-binding protein [Methylotenera sp.]